MFCRATLVVTLAVLFIACSGQSGSGDDYQKPMTTLEREHARYDSVGMNYDHVQTYSFQVSHVEDFIIAVDAEQTIRGNMRVYWEQDGAFIESVEEVGEQTRLMIYEDRRVILLNEVFYNSHGFTFQAKKNREYIIRVMKTGRDKLAIMNLENYLKEGHADYQLVSGHLNPHENKTSRIKEELRVNLMSLQSYLVEVERTAVLNQQIATHVQKHTQHYIWWQWLEIALVVVASLAQVRVIKRLLGNSSSVV